MPAMDFCGREAHVQAQQDMEQRQVWEVCKLTANLMMAVPSNNNHGMA